MSDADLLRRAAARVRETANALPDPHNTRWKPITLEPNERFGDYAWWVNTDIHTPAVDGTRSDTTIAECGWSGADANHIALWHPGVALAVADWLESTAAAVERHARKVNLGLVRPDRSHEPALDVARALLGEGTR